MFDFQTENVVCVLRDKHIQWIYFIILWLCVHLKTDYLRPSKSQEVVNSFSEASFKIGYMDIMSVSFITLIFAGIFQSACSIYYSLWNNKEKPIYFKVHRKSVFLKSYILPNWKIEWKVKVYAYISLCCVSICILHILWFKNTCTHNTSVWLQNITVPIYTWNIWRENLSP